MNETGIADIISIGRVTLIVETIEHPRQFKASETSLEDTSTFYESDPYKKT